MFNLSTGELVVLFLLGLIFFGVTTRPQPREQVVTRSNRSPRRLDVPESAWGRSEWLLVGGILVLGSLALALVAARS